MVSSLMFTYSCEGLSRPLHAFMKPQEPKDYQLHLSYLQSTENKKFAEISLCISRSNDKILWIASKFELAYSLEFLLAFCIPSTPWLMRIGLVIIKRGYTTHLLQFLHF